MTNITLEGGVKAYERLTWSEIKGFIQKDIKCESMDYDSKSNGILTR